MATTNSLPLSPAMDRFTPMALLKRGPCGVVSLLADLERGQRVVGRCLALPAGRTEAQLLESLTRQTSLRSQLSHANLPAFEGLMEGAGGPWLLYQYCSGTRLSQYLDREKDLPDEWIVWWFFQLLLALDALHSHEPPLCVGYLEPDDVIVHDSQLWLADQGLFEHVFPEAGAALYSAHPFGNFIAPDKVHSALDMPAADLFSAGAVAFWLLTGRAPVVRQSRDSIMHRDLLEQSRPELSHAVTSLIISMLSFYPSQRPASARDAIDKLRPWVQPMQDEKLPVANEFELAFVARATNQIEPADEVRVPRPAFEPSPRRPKEPVEKKSSFLRLGALGLAAVVLVAAASMMAGSRRTAAPSHPAVRPRPVVKTPAVTGPRLSVGDELRADSGQPLSVPFEDGRLTLGSESAVRILGADPSHLTLELLKGSLHVVPGSGGTVVVRANSQIVCAYPGSVASLEGSSVTCESGKVTLRGHVVEPGSRKPL